jgi:hypothetical protein
MSDRDSEESSSSSSSSDEEDASKEDVDLADIKLQQMKRKARAKAEAKEGKGNQRMAGLQSYEDMMREHALQRMQVGLKELLMMHTPPELSSICGVLGLPAKEKASTSIKSILDFASKGGRLNPERTRDLLGKMWEGALFEYLRSIGHPQMTMFLDPKETVMKIWLEGGLIGNADFIPSFVAREVKKRYEWVTSPDIEEKLRDLRINQEWVKKAETSMLSGADFTFVLDYLKKMNNLRKMENDMREYLIGQLEIARSRIDSQLSTAAMTREDMAECEEKLVTLVGAVSDKLAYCESMAETYMNENFTTEGDLQRLTDIVESYITAEEDRAEAGGGTAQASSLRHPDLSRQSIKNLHRKLQEYRNMRDEHDEELRERARGHIDEVDRLDAYVRSLEHQLEYKSRDELTNRMRAEEAERDVKFCARKMLKMSLNKQIGVQEGWGYALRRKLELDDLQRRLKDVKSIVKVALLTRDNDMVVAMATGINDAMNMLSPDELREMHEGVAMSKADDFSMRLRKREEEQAAKRRQGPKKTVASASGKADDSEKDGKDDESKGTSKASKTKKSKKDKGDGEKKDGAKKKKKK